MSSEHRDREAGGPAALRPAAFVMSPERAGASFPTPLNFARSFARKMLRERWRISRVRLELDAEGRGEALYRLDARGEAFHLVVVSNVFPQAQKVDRSFGINWDASAALCQGPWSEERAEHLKPEVQKQYLGRYDRDTLCFTRGNRSERIFDEVVDALASGRQPDPRTLAPVGYIFRTTAFAGNGLFGIRPFDGLGGDHPLAEPYHVQMAAAFLLREFVADLADHIAQARSPAAVRLDPRLRRYLGLGNSAGQGLIPFISSHPHIIHRWVLTQEEALAAARARPVAEGTTHADLVALASKAIRYFEEDPRDGNGIFTSYVMLASELRIVCQRIESAPRTGTWGALLDRAVTGVGMEAAEATSVMLLEVFPDIATAHDGRFASDESFDTVPEMTRQELRRLIKGHYAWALSSPSGRPSGAANYWYQPVEAPDEPRRGRRGIAPEYERESRMDLPWSLPRLLAAIDEPNAPATVAELLATRPDLRHVVRHIQSTAELEYAELRESTIATGYSPFAGERFLLAFYGMEKLDPRPPRSVKGAFLQGAPTAEDIAAGRDGDWPFPLIPELGSASPLASLSARGPLRLLETPDRAPSILRRVTGGTGERSYALAEVPFYAAEYRKLMVRALLVAGLPLGFADDLTHMGETADALSGGGLPELLRLLPELAATPRAAIELDGVTGRLSAGADPGILLAPAALDLATAAARRSPGKAGLAVVANARGAPLLDRIAIAAAERGLVGIVGWRSAEGLCGHLLAIPCEAGIVFARAGWLPAWLAATLAGRAADRTGALASLPAGGAIPAATLLATHEQQRVSSEGMAVCCLAPERMAGGSGALVTALRDRMSGNGELLAPETLAARFAATRSHGFRITGIELQQLEAVAKRWLIPESIEPTLAIPHLSP